MRGDRWLSPLADRLRTAIERRRSPWSLASSRDDYLRQREARPEQLAARRRVERALARSPGSRRVPGYCFVCARDRDFLLARTAGFEIDGLWAPNWREELLCPGCHLNNRMRAAFHFFSEAVRPGPTTRVYLTEQASWLAQRLAARLPQLLGSEYLGPARVRGEIGASGLRHEDLAALSFPDASFEVALCFDVLEHVVELDPALSELARVLTPDGKLLLSVPFRTDLEMNQTLAEVDPTGRVKLFGEPEFHRHLVPPTSMGAEPASFDCLTYRRFGWQLLDDLRRAGFTDVTVVAYWSRALGYLGADQLLFLAGRAASPS